MRASRNRGVPSVPSTVLGRTLRRLACVGLLVAMLPAAGCVGLTAQLLYLWNGHPVKAQFKHLEGKRVAVVCVSRSSAMGPGTETELLARDVSRMLNSNVDDITLIHPDDIADWMDTNDWNQVDYREVGRGVKADMLVALELDGFKLYEGQTMFRGKANVHVMVLDMAKKGLVVFEKHHDDFTFPANGGHHTTDTTEARFRRFFINQLAFRVARSFYDYDLLEDFGDSANMSGL